MPLPLSPNMGFGMNVAVLPLRCETFFTMCLNHISLSAICDELVEAHVDLALTGGRDFVVAHLDLDADLLHLEADLGAQVHLRVLRLDREVAFLVADLVAEVRALVAAGVPDGLVRVDRVERPRSRPTWKRTSSKMKNSASGPK